MSTELIVTDLQQLDSGNSPLIELFELEVDTDTFVYFTNYVEATGPLLAGSPNNVIQFRDFTNNNVINEYYPIPTQLTGIEHKTDGALPQPSLTIANVLSTAVNDSLQGLIGSVTYEDLLGLRFIRRRTLKKYLYDNPSDSIPPVELPRDIYFLDRIEEENPVSVTFTLVSPIDLTNVTLPRRTIIGNACPWKYQGASVDKNNWERVGGCSWHSQGEIAQHNLTANVYVTFDDEYIIDDSISFPTYTSGAVNSQENYKTLESGLTKIQPNGSLVIDSVFDPTGNVDTGADELTFTGNNFVTGDLIRYSDGGGDIGLTDQDPYYLNVSGAVIKFYDTEANAVTGGAGGLADLTTPSGTTHTLSPASYNYWQAVNDTGSPGTPDETDPDWSRVRLGVTYTTSIAVAVYTEDRFNTFVLNSSQAWKGITRSQAPDSHEATPGFSSVWERGDNCGKRLLSCVKRFGVNSLYDLDYDAQGANFTLGEQVRGENSNARATIVADTDGGSAGTLTLGGIIGNFIDNEPISEINGSGNATTNGVATKSNFRPNTTPIEGKTLPFGGFPTARVFT